MKSSYRTILKTISLEHLEEIDKGYGKLIYKVLDKTISNFLISESKTPFEIIKLEEKLIRVLKKDNLSIKLKGAVDRIDMVKINDNNVIRIIDYKTGKSTDFKQIKEIDSDIGKIPFQLLHYAYCYNSDKDFKSSAFFVMDRSKIQRDLSINKETIITQDIKNDVFSKFENLLMEIFNEIFDIETPFSQTEDEKNCNTCLYSDICGI